jgi:hypothetical protein
MALEGNRPNPIGNPSFWWRPTCICCKTQMYDYSSSDCVPIRIDGKIEQEYVCSGCRRSRYIGFYRECPPCKKEIAPDGICPGCKTKYGTGGRTKVIIPDWQKTGVFGY